jgi:Arc/MetJ family transcription regulator
MKPTTADAEAVLNAADEWVSAQEALIAATQVSLETDAEREAVDLAGSRLVSALTRWRSTR